MKPAVPNASTSPVRPAARRPGHARPSRSVVAALAVAAAFLIVAGQLVRLAVRGQSEPVTTLSQAVSTGLARPDIVDRNGRLLASDVEVPSLYADPALVLDRDEVAEKLARVLPDLDEAEVRRLLADRTRRFVWLRRGLSPRVAQEIHDLGLPGLAFRRELRRVYPAGRLAGHVIGAVNVDNRGIAGLERHLDQMGAVDSVHGATLTGRAPLRASLDLGVQHALDDELTEAIGRFEAKGAAGLVLDVRTGEVLAAQSLPGVDPARPGEFLDAARQDKLFGAVYELGSIMKLVTVAMALDGGHATADTVLDVRQPLEAGRYTIRDAHPAGRPLTVGEIFVRSSNVGSGLLALAAGAERQQAFLARLGLTSAAETEAGAVAAPLLPGPPSPAAGADREPWGRIETITLAYGHGIAVAPLGFAAAAASLVNGGIGVAPTFLRRLGPDAGAVPRERVVSAATSGTLSELLRRNVTDPGGTGRLADVPGYRIGGKTGTAELPARGGYRETAVISSFLAAFPTDRPRYVALLMLFEPKPTSAARGQRTAGANAAPTAGRLVARIAPLLGIMPEGAVAPLPDDGVAAAPDDTARAFDGGDDAKY